MTYAMTYPQPQYYPQQQQQYGYAHGQYNSLPPQHVQRPPPPSPYSQRTPSPPDPSYARGADGDDDGTPPGSIYAQNKARYDNPLAHNDAWAPTQEDHQLRQLPKIDFTLRVKARLSRSAGKPFEPEPRSFQRPPRVSHLAGQSFQPILLKSDGKTGLIGAGFVPNYFGPVMAAHDVSAADFARFLEDIFTAGKVSGARQVVANVAPVTMHMGVTGYFVTKAIVKAMSRRNEPLVCETIETWQDRFFGPRGLDVYVAVRGERVTAKHVGVTPEPLPPAVAAMTQSMASRSHKKKDRKKDHDKEKPVLIVAPLSGSRGGGYY